MVVQEFVRQSQWRVLEVLGMLVGVVKEIVLEISCLFSPLNLLLVRRKREREERDTGLTDVVD